jgi:hypothetical protein
VTRGAHANKLTQTLPTTHQKNRKLQFETDIQAAIGAFTHRQGCEGLGGPSWTHPSHGEATSAPLGPVTPPSAQIYRAKSLGKVEKLPYDCRRILLLSRHNINTPRPCRSSEATRTLLQPHRIQSSEVIAVLFGSVPFTPNHTQKVAKNQEPKSTSQSEGR